VCARARARARARLYSISLISGLSTAVVMAAYHIWSLLPPGIYSVRFLYSSIYSLCFLYSSIYSVCFLYSSIYSVCFLYSSIYSICFLYSSIYSVCFLYSSFYNVCFLYSSVYSVCFLYSSMYSICSCTVQFIACFLYSSIYSICFLYSSIYFSLNRLWTSLECCQTDWALVFMYWPFLYRCCLFNSSEVGKFFQTFCSSITFMNNGMGQLNVMFWNLCLWKYRPY
jgi:hypothetical protein